MNKITVVFSVLTILMHVLIFIGESFLWGNPIIVERVLSKIETPYNVSIKDQAQILDVLFYNQGFYNLFVALGGIVGLILYKLGHVKEGLTLVCYMCLFAFCASIVLAFSTTAYLAVIIQGLSPLIALLALCYSHRKSIRIPMIKS